MPQMPQKVKEYYTFQHRRTHEGPWLRKGTVKKIKPEPEWSFSSWDHFGGVINPLTAKGDDYEYPGTEECHQVWSDTRSHGFYNLKYAEQALNRLRKANDEGKWNTYGTYGDWCQDAVYEFRIVKVTWYKEIVEPLDL